MRILLRNRLTRLYLLSGDGESCEWTEDREAARAFPSSFEALKFVQEQGLEDMEVVLTFGKPDMDMSITAETIRPKRQKPPSHEHPSS